MRVHIYPDIGVGLATGSPFRMKAETWIESNRAKIALRNVTAERAGVIEHDRCVLPIGSLSAIAAGARARPAALTVLDRLERTQDRGGCGSAPCISLLY